MNNKSKASINRDTESDNFKRIGQIAKNRLEARARKKGVSVEKLLEDMPIGEPGNGIVVMSGNIYRSQGKIISREEVDAELAKPFNFAKL